MIWPLLLATGVVVVGGAAWQLSVEQISFLAIGVSCLFLAWLVWRHGLIGYSYSEGFNPETGEVGPPTTAVTRSPLPRRVLAPALVVIAIAFLLAGTRTGVGTLLYGPVHGAVSAWEFVGATWNLLISTGLFVATLGTLGYSVIRRDGDALVAGGCLGGLLAFAVVANYVVYLINEDFWRQEWNDFLAPLRTVVELFT